MIRILIVDDHTMVRDGLSRLLSGESDMTVVGQTGFGKEGISMCQGLKPDVVILDFSLPDMDGLEVTRQITDLGLPCRILILTMYSSEEYATRLIKAGAAGFVVKAAPADELLTAIRKVAGKGGIYVSPPILEKMVGRMGHPQEDIPEALLSNREMQVLVRLAKGESTREVSEALSLSLSTVETYRSRILDKLSLRNNSDITRFAIRRGLIEMEG